MADAVRELLETVAPDLKGFAKESGVGYSTLRGWKDEGRIPRDESLRKLMAHLEERLSETERLMEQVRRLRERTPERRPNRKRASP